jgi:hypothetical protein
LKGAKELWWNSEKGELNDFLKDVQFVNCAACGSAITPLLQYAFRHLTEILPET